MEDGVAWAMRRITTRIDIGLHIGTIWISETGISGIQDQGIIMRRRGMHPMLSHVRLHPDISGMLLLLGKTNAMILPRGRAPNVMTKRRQEGVIIKALIAVAERSTDLPEQSDSNAED